MKIEIHAMDHKTVIRKYDRPVTAQTIAASLQKELPYEIVSCRINQKNCRLNEKIDRDCVLDLLDMRDSSANMVYQVSLTFLYIKAVHDVLSPSVEVTIANSLNKGLFTIIHASGIDRTAAGKIQKRMKEMVRKNLPFEQKEISRSGMKKALNAFHLMKQMQLLESASDLRSAYLCRLDGETELFYHPLTPSTGYLKCFEVRRYKNGMLLRFPQQFQPDVLQPYEDQKLLYEAFSEETRWDRIMQINTACDLNERILQKDEVSLVLLSEALHEKKIAEIADQIHQSGKRIILIAGPSSSGKTTFAKRLCIQLRVLGLRPLYLGTDDYFREREETPSDEKGNPDFESLKALDIDLFANQMNDLLAGKKTDLPAFDFVSGHKKYGERITSIDRTQPIVIEGIHGLNPKLTEGIADEQKFRIYISPLTQINIDEHNRIPTTDARMLRRLIRDYSFRGRGAETTIRSWPSVRAGEEKYIFPYNGEADVFFNSQCLYELPVLKKYAEPLLRQIQPGKKEYAEAQRMLEFLECFVTMEDDDIIPNNSILREFIGGSILVPR